MIDFIILTVITVCMSIGFYLCFVKFEFKCTENLMDDKTLIKT